MKRGAIGMKLTKKSSAFLIGLAAGSVIGSISALLFAPKSGKELRKDIRNGAGKISEATANTIDTVSETIFEVSKQVEDRTLRLVDGAKQNVAQAADSIKQMCQTEDSEPADKLNNHVEAEQLANVEVK